MDNYITGLFWDRWADKPDNFNIVKFHSAQELIGRELIAVLHMDAHVSPILLGQACSRAKVKTLACPVFTNKGTWVIL